ncbi:hypothetical protein [Mucilaginibacter sp.]
MQISITASPTVSAESIRKILSQSLRSKFQLAGAGKRFDGSRNNNTSFWF